MKQRTFGRRAAKERLHIGNGRDVAVNVTQNEDDSGSLRIPLSNKAIRYQEDSVDVELREWKKERRKQFKVPWRQVSFMASACFGIASFVLPDSLNHTIQWLLLVLGVLSLAGGLSSYFKRL